MFVDYNLLSDKAKVWIYPSNRKFYQKQLESLTDKLDSFIKQWKKDNDNFKATYKLLYDRFIIFLAENNTIITIKDIDFSIEFIIKLQKFYNIKLLDKMNVCFKQGEYIQYKDLKSFKKLVKNKSINNETTVFDNLIETKYDLENYWEIPIKESWYNRFI